MDIITLMDDQKYRAWSFNHRMYYMEGTHGFYETVDSYHK